MIKILSAAIVAFCVCAAVMPLVIMLGKKLKVRQTILSYVDNHISKSGTPTMGGIGVMIALSICCPVFSNKDNTLMLVTLFVTLGYGIIGFIDDFIKVFFKQNKGLSPLQKIVFQLLIAVIVSVFAYNNSLVGSVIYAPFTLKELDLGMAAIPLFMLVFLAFTNSVNLTDGLDGLVAKTSSVNLVFYVIIIYVCYYYAKQMGQTFYTQELLSLEYFAIALLGAMLAFIWQNNFPAKILMGDTGSLAMGGALACLAIFISQPLIILLTGIMYIVSCISVILQVASFKIRKKRIFLIAPYHHHLEYKGIHENRVVSF